MRRITCKNENLSITFGDSFSPFLLQDCDGIYLLDNGVNTVDNSMSDGATYVGSNLKLRNIVLTLASKGSHALNRNYLYSLFKPKTPGKFIYYEDGDYVVEREIDYYVEKVEISSMYSHRVATVSLICPDPYFKDRHDTVTTMTGWIDNFIFPHEFKEIKEELGTLTNEKIKGIYNDSTTSEIGLKVIFDANGNVKNPGILRVEDNKKIIIGTTLKPLNMVMNDQLVVTTGLNDKNAYFNGKNVNDHVDETSSFIQLNIGLNTFRYFAEEGEDNLLVSIVYRKSFLGV